MMKTVKWLNRLRYLKLSFLSLILTISLFTFHFSLSAQIVPQVTVAVDTNDNDIKTAYHLYKNYLNSHPDSVYNNPYWSGDEWPANVGSNLPADKFFWANSWFEGIFPKCRFTVIGINKVYNSDTYIIRTVIFNDSIYAHYGGRLNDPVFITVYYAKPIAGGWELMNASTVETQNWNHYNTKFIQYIYPPEYKFDKQMADKADAFCQAVIDTLGFDPPAPFKYYITTGIEQMGRLYNMEYWSSWVMGYTNIPSRTIVTARATEYHLHEFVHVLLPLCRNNMIEEGIATYFAGPGHTTFADALAGLRNDLKNNDTVTFSDIYNKKYFRTDNSDAFYVTGAVVCMFVREKKGINGLRELLRCPGNSEEDFYKTVFSILHKDKKAFDKEIMDYIRTGKS